jgi:hypothetical protein
MTFSYARYSLTEAAVTIGMSCTFTFISVWLQFREPALITDLGFHLTLDAIPQTFSLVFMCAFMPTMLTRIRRRQGRCPSLEGPSPRPRNAVLRALLIAALAAPIGAAATLGATRLLPLSGASFMSIVLGKCLYASLVATVITYIALPLALRDPLDRPAT